MKKNLTFFRLLQAYCFVDFRETFIRRDMSDMQLVFVGHRLLDALWPSVYHCWCEIWETLDVFSRSEPLIMVQLTPDLLVIYLLLQSIANESDI